MYKQLFHIFFEFLFKCFCLLLMCFLFIVFLSVVSVDARPIRGYKPPHRHAPKVTKKNHVNLIGGAVAGGIIAYALLNPNKSNREHKYNQHGED